ncbi:MAG: metallophosphoesterase [Fibrobacteraceae bacterium]|mgnify:CR=1 FL=1|nr:metallophosphoesterase [Fibrobacteraceae bacterium]
MIFIFILIFGLSFLYLSIRNVSHCKVRVFPFLKGSWGQCTVGSLVGLAFLLGTFACFLFRKSFVATAGQAFFAVWLCEALLIFVCFGVFRLCRRGVRGRPIGVLALQRASRVLLVLSVVVSVVFLIVGGIRSNTYKVIEADIRLGNGGKSFTGVFLSDIHVDPIFNRSKLERFAAQMDSLHPDFIFLGGDIADMHSNDLLSEGYGPLFLRIASAAKSGAFAVSGNHESYMTRSDSDPIGFMTSSGWTFLSDSTTCTELACISGRIDHQLARAMGVSRKGILELAPKDSSRCWLMLDHQPKGLWNSDENPVQNVRLPDFAMSGHTHDGQFFPGTVIINWVWKLAYGLGRLDGIPWLVSSGFGNWGPGVRIGSTTEIWILHFSY